MEELIKETLKFNSFYQIDVFLQTFLLKKTFRRGILLHGPPGCGKTSFIVALAGHLDLGKPVYF